MFWPIGDFPEILTVTKTLYWVIEKKSSLVSVIFTLCDLTKEDCKKKYIAKLIEIRMN